ncbi:MAG: Inosose isomerase, partial [uncultured Blastococcus sp.]
APPDHTVHRPVGRPAVRGDVRAGLRLGVRRPGDRLLGRPPRRRARRERRLLRAGAPGDPQAARPAGLRDLQPPQRPGRLRRPDRRAAPRHGAPARLGRRRPRGRPSAGGGGDEADRAGGAQARRRRRRRLHRLEDLEDRGDVPARARVDDRGRLPRLRGPLEPDPRRLRRGRREVRPRGAPVGDRLRL